MRARIVMTTQGGADDDLYDTVIGYRSGNWIYGELKQAMDWQQKACQEQDAMRGWRTLLASCASTLYNICDAYPHLKGDELRRNERERWRNRAL